MDTVTSQYLLYAALAVGGMAVRHFFPGLFPASPSPAAPASPSAPALPPLPGQTPALPPALTAWVQSAEKRISAAEAWLAALNAAPPAPAAPKP